MAKKYYKNVLGETIKMTLFGVGEVNIPATAKAVELEEGVAKAIMSMTPDPTLEEVQVKVTPIVDGEDVTGEEEPQNVPALEDLTKKELIAILEAAGKEFNAKATNAELIALIRE